MLEMDQITALLGVAVVAAIRIVRAIFEAVYSTPESYELRLYQEEEEAILYWKILPVVVSNLVGGLL